MLSPIAITIKGGNLSSREGALRIEQETSLTHAAGCEALSPQNNVIKEGIYPQERKPCALSGESERRKTMLFPIAITIKEGIYPQERKPCALSRESECRKTMLFPIAITIKEGIYPQEREPCALSRRHR